MAVPTVPTQTSIVTEAFAKHQLTPTAAQITRAKDEWMQEVRNDIWDRAKKIKALHSTSILIIANGQSRYSMPTDYSSDMVMQLLDGTIVAGTAQTGAAGTLTLAATDGQAAGDAIGKRFLITGGTAKGSMSQCTAFNASTKVVTVVPNFQDTPDNTSTYERIDNYTTIDPKPIWRLRGMDHRSERGTPEKYYTLGDSDYSEFELYPIPYRTDSKFWGLQLTYYVDLMRVDLSGTLMATLYLKWRNLFTQGLYFKLLQSLGNSKKREEERTYNVMLGKLLSRETYGMDQSNMQTTVED